MTLALLVTAEAGAWAQSLSTYSELTLEIGSGGSIELNHDYYAYDYGYPIVITQDNSVIDGKGAVIDMAGAGIDHALKITASDVTIKNLIIINHTQAGDAIFFEEGGFMEDVLYDALPLTSQTANPWTFMLKYNNVLVNVAYKDRTSIALTFDGAAIPAAGVKGFLGLEQEFIAKLTAAVTNTDDNNAAVDNAELTFTSSDATVIAFGSNNKASGKLADIKFLKQSTEPVTLTAAFDGTADLGKSPEQTLAVTVGEKTYTVTLSSIPADADKWSAKTGDATIYSDLPLDGVKAGQSVTLKYEGRRKVKSVTATAAP